MRTKITLLLIAVLFMIATNTNATVRTVSNDPSGGSQYTNILAAYNASTNGDTLLMEGTNIAYSAAFQATNNFWAKSLTVIGIGFNPMKQLPRRTIISAFGDSNNNPSFVLAAGGNGSRFYGIEFENGVNQNGGPTSNILFENCKFNNTFSFGNAAASNYTFSNCVFDGNNTGNVNFATAGANSNILFTNCIFDGNFANITGQSPTFHSVTFDHCLFLSTAGTVNYLQNALFKNSIFMNSATINGIGSPNNAYVNCINRLGTFPANAGNANNQENTNPNFITYTLGSFYSTAWNFDLQAGSTAIAAANDGTDIGLHGGSSGFHETGEVQIVPIMRQVNVYNTTVPSGGTLNVHINATQPND